MSVAREITRFTHEEVKQIFKDARRVIKHPGIHILRGPKKKDFGRILIIISRKVGNAVERNKLRRHIRSIFYQEKLYKHPYDFIALTKPGATNISFPELKRMLKIAVSSDAINK